MTKQILKQRASKEPKKAYKINYLIHSKDNKIKMRAKVTGLPVMIEF